jgi:hypothetical protein
MKARSAVSSAASNDVRPDHPAVRILTDAVGRKGVWLAGSAAVAVSILMLARTRTYRGALVAVVLLGIGWAQVNEQRPHAGGGSCRPPARTTRVDEFLRLRLRIWRVRHADGAGADPATPRGTERAPAAGDARQHLWCWASSPRYPPPVPPQVLAAAADRQTAPISGSAALEPGLLYLIRLPVLRATETSGRLATTLVLRQTPSDVPDARARQFAAALRLLAWFHRQPLESILGHWRPDAAWRDQRAALLRR